MEGLIYALDERGDLGSFEIELVNSGIYSAQGLRGFGLGGLGRP